MAAKVASSDRDDAPWFLRTSYPVLVPAHDALTKPRNEFDAFIRHDLARSRVFAHPREASDVAEMAQSLTDIDLSHPRQDTNYADSASNQEESSPANGATGHPFMDALLGQKESSHKKHSMGSNTMLTENLDVTNVSTTSPLADLFAELEEVVSGTRLRELLESTWRHDPLATLKIIFNARSIHLGKGSRNNFYSCAGWLAENHPLTLVANLEWLTRPVIAKKLEKDDDDAFVMVEGEKDESDSSRYDVAFGVAHGYWKDLLNILALAANGHLTVLSDPRAVLNVENPQIVARKRKREGVHTRRLAAASPCQSPQKVADQTGTGLDEKVDEDDPKETARADATSAEEPWKAKRRQVQRHRHLSVHDALKDDPLYRALHMTVARLFAEQLEWDLAALHDTDAEAKRKISLCAKWAPTHGRFHDKHTLIASSIAEIMHPRESLHDAEGNLDGDRETYLRHAREAYRRDTSALRKHLQVVERDITTRTYANIRYDRVPSAAMKNYTRLFAEHDFDRFEKYLGQVAAGKANISGATLLPSTLVHLVSKDSPPSTGQLLDRKIRALEMQAADGQWRTLVNRIRDSGTLSSSIAVCDVSGSMMSPCLPDKTVPMESAIGLSLLIAAVTAPPFGGTFISFSDDPQVHKIDVTLPLSLQVQELQKADWGFSTDFVAVFERLILPMAVNNKIQPGDMVKRVFVFSDMQFNNASARPDAWQSSYEHIKSKFASAGYDMPELIFWNLAGGRGGSTAPKPVTIDDKGTSLVSGYSQGMLKVFLDGGGFEEPDEEDGDQDESDDGSRAGRETVKMNPLRTVKKAIGHKAYDMLRVLD